MRIELAARCDQHQVGILRKRNERLTAERMPFHGCHLQRKLARLTLQQTNQWLPMTVCHINLCQVMEALGCAIVNRIMMRALFGYHVSECGKRFASKFLDLHSTSPICAIRPGRDQQRHMIGLFRSQDPEPNWDLVQERIIGPRAKVWTDLKDKFVLTLLKLRANQKRLICPSIRIRYDRF